METLLHRCCGLDVHFDQVTACLLITQEAVAPKSDTEETAIKEIREFNILSDGLVELRQ